MRSSDWSSDVCSSDLLDHSDAGRLQVGNLITQGQSQLLASGGARLIVPDKRPLQNGDRTGEHPFDRLFGQRLRIGGPSNRHGRRANHVTKNNGGLHAARTVALHPSVLGKSKTAQQLAKILDHVVRSEEHTSELQSLMRISYAVFCLKKNKHK